MTRAAKRTAKLSVTADMTLPAIKTASTKSIAFFRSNRDMSSGMTGPDTATMRANKLTNAPASEIDTPKYADTYGRRPITPISVFKMPNTPTAKIKINNRCPFIMASYGRNRRRRCRIRYGLPQRLPFSLVL